MVHHHISKWFIEFCFNEIHRKLQFHVHIHTIECCSFADPSFVWKVLLPTNIEKPANQSYQTKMDKEVHRWILLIQLVTSIYHVVFACYITLCKQNYHFGSLLSTVETATNPHCEYQYAPLPVLSVQCCQLVSRILQSTQTWLFWCCSWLWLSF